MAEAEKLPSVIIHGSLSLNKRKQVLDSFRSPAGPNILLMTLGTGAVGYVKIYAPHDMANHIIQTESCCCITHLLAGASVESIPRVPGDGPGASHWTRSPS
jgi:hypothetical protein